MQRDKWQFEFTSKQLKDAAALKVQHHQKLLNFWEGEKKHTSCAADLDKCHSKIMEHSSRIREYEGWVRVFASNPDGKLTLNADDYLFFYSTEVNEA